MRRSIWLLGAVTVVLLGVGCGPPDPEELLEQTQAPIASPILMGAGCPAANACGPDYGKCTEWSGPTSCGPTCAVFQYQTCFDARGNQCLNVSLSPATADGCD